MSLPSDPLHAERALLLALAAMLGGCGAATVPARAPSPPSEPEVPLATLVAPAPAPQLLAPAADEPAPAPAAPPAQAESPPGPLEEQDEPRRRRPRASERSPYRVPRTPKGTPRGIVAPYPLDRVFRGFGRCRKGRHVHQAIDIGGIGKDAGLGSPVRAITHSRVTLIGLPADDPEDFGTPDRRRGTVRRGYKGRLVLPRSRIVPGYGRVYFFTRDYGRWRSGAVVITKGLSGPLKDHVIRYMHLGAVHPRLQRRKTLEPSQELGLMGGTAVMETSPHLHIDITDPDGKRVDVAKLYGLPQAAEPCPEP